MSNRQIWENTYLGVLVDLQSAGASVESRDFGDIIVLALALFFLELEGDATHGSTLDAFHEVSSEPRDFVTETL